VSNATTLTLDGPAADGYDVIVGEDLLDSLPHLLGERVRRVAVVHPVALAGLGERVRAALGSAGLDAHALQIPDGEAAKDVSVAAHCWQELGRLGFTRSDAVVTVGGGATTDMGGFVAATWLRGVEVVHMPTTLLAMVDAAVGGKTGMNTEEGKNLVGAFHEPGGVLCDLTVLSTLPRPELVSGMAEVVKCGFIADPEILAIVERSPSDALAVGSAELRELVERAIQVKLDVVAGDFRETGGSAAIRAGRRSTTGTRWATRSSVPSGTGGGTGTRSRSAWSSSPSSPGGRGCWTRVRRSATGPSWSRSAFPRRTPEQRGPTCWAPCGSTRSRAGTSCASSCWRTSPARWSSRGRRRSS